jgi:DnaJ family protein A protein 2
MPSFRHHDPGNMYVLFEVEFPDSAPHMDDAQKETLKQILGVPPKSAQQKAADQARKTQSDPNGMEVDTEALELDPLAQPIPKGQDEEEVDLEDVDHSNASRAHGATMMDEDDEDGVPHGAERMQCASQ